MHLNVKSLIAYLAVSLGLFACLAWLLALGYLGRQAASAVGHAVAAMVS